MIELGLNGGIKGEILTELMGTKHVSYIRGLNLDIKRLSKLAIFLRRMGACEGIK